jgi:hypothetical protein
MVHHVYSVVRHEDGWAVVHIDKRLAVHPTHKDAEKHVERLARLTQVSGHDAEVVIEAEAGGVESDEVYRRFER